MRIKTIGDLAKTDKTILIKLFGKHGNMMWEYANGIDTTPVKYIKEDPKSIGNSVTLPRDIYKMEELNEILLTLAEQVSYRLRKYNMVATTVSVQLRTKDFEDYFLLLFQHYFLWPLLHRFLNLCIHRLKEL